jgi:hypothetical protein
MEDRGVAGPLPSILAEHASLSELAFRDAEQYWAETSS